MTIHKSLKSGSSMTRHRNVLTRPERIAKLKENERWNEEESVYGLPKVRNIMVKATAKKKVKDE